MGARHSAVDRGQLVPHRGLTATPSPLWFLLVAGLALVAYARSFGAEFQFDDHQQILDNPDIREPTWGGLIVWGRTRILPLLTFLLNYRLGGDDPFGYHAINCGLHLLTCWLVYHLVLALCRTPRVRDTWVAERSLGLALTVALLMALHPIQVQAVTYIVQRLTVMATLFYVGAVLLYVRSRSTAVWWAYPISLLLALGASFSKENAASLPAAILLTDRVFFRDGGWGRALVRCLPFALLALAMLIAFQSLDRPLVRPRASAVATAPLGDAPKAVARAPAQPPAAAPAPRAAPAAESWLAGRLRTFLDRASRWGDTKEEVSPAEYLLTQCRVIPRYLRLTFLPWGFNVDHSVPIERGFSLAAAAGAVFLAGLAGFGLYATGPWPLVGYGILWFFIALSVESSLLPIGDPMNEHRMYLAMPGVALVLATLFAWALRHRRALAQVAGAGVVAALTALTIARNETWRTQLSLWQDALAKSPGKARVRVNLGAALHLHGDVHAAVKEYCEALRLEPTNRRAESNLNIALDQLMGEGEVEMELVSTGPDGLMELVPRHPCPPTPRAQ